ncbi:hypothetical protein GCM10022243_48870 [Saccharothrix violaceirubra]|uniref:DNA methylase n=1 Tax=Saccharothrix violaceirubra TaxID=413306 RepID=A0A7W7SZE8_9PSEU|nr:class I SAM-dependent methyltransferase [Saccharothrix violaceirubra]MBB4963771.1 hypothetical protein [Saccharothrix violaceirubra]
MPHPVIAWDGQPVGDRYPAMDVVPGVLPWSTLDQDSRPWQDRKKHWHDLGVRDTTPRDHAAGMMTTGRHGALSGGVSRFDPVLAEVLYRWYCPPGGRVLDPCAGGPVRGLVASHLGLEYVGVDLDADQVDANTAVAAGSPYPSPAWFAGDALTYAWPVSDGDADMVLTCPPYHDRERYSDDPRDLSTMDWPAFLDAHRAVVGRAAAALREDRFLAWVISDVRDRHGHLRGLPRHAWQHLEDAGLHVVNEHVLRAPVGTAHKRMRPPWQACRTATRRHQIVLVAVKGDRRAATRAVSGGGGC